MNLSEKIKNTRLEYGITQDELSKRLNLPRYIIANWEQGRSNPSFDDISLLADCFNCTVDYLLDREDFSTVQTIGKTKDMMLSMRIKELRKERGLTTQEVGSYLGVGKGTYNHWETGRCEPDIATLKKLADFFCVSIDYLVGADVRTAAPMGETLTKEESDLLTFFRGMDNVCKEAIMTTAHNFYNLNKNSSAMVR